MRQQAAAPPFRSIDWIRAGAICSLRMGIGLVGPWRRGKNLSYHPVEKALYAEYSEHIKTSLAKMTGTVLPSAPMDIALYQPDMPPNTGTLLRLGACMGCPVHVIEPCGFPFSQRALRRYAMDYGDQVQLRRHDDWIAFERWRTGAAKRLVLLTTKATLSYGHFSYQTDDVLMVGRESAGVPEDVHAAADARVRIPMIPAVRSLNVAISLAMVLGEALRQTGEFPNDQETQS